jgi:hypothetical protein
VDKLCTASFSPVTNKLLNPGFETFTGNDFASWTEFGTEVYATTTAPYQGLASMAAADRSSVDVGVYQDVAGIIAGVQYTVNGAMKTWNAGSPTLPCAGPGGTCSWRIEVEWRNGSGGVISTDLLGENINYVSSPSWVGLSEVLTAPIGAVTARVRPIIQDQGTYGGTNNGWVWFDAMEFIGP